MKKGKRENPRENGHKVTETAIIMQEYSLLKTCHSVDFFVFIRKKREIYVCKVGGTLTSALCF